MVPKLDFLGAIMVYYYGWPLENCNPPPFPPDYVGQPSGGQEASLASWVSRLPMNTQGFQRSFTYLGTWVPVVGYLGKLTVSAVPRARAHGNTKSSVWPARAAAGAGHGGARAGRRRTHLASLELCVGDGACGGARAARSGQVHIGTAGGAPPYDTSPASIHDYM